jgi:hypothetical protein
MLGINKNIHSYIAFPFPQIPLFGIWGKDGKGALPKTLTQQ